MGIIITLLIVYAIIHVGCVLIGGFFCVKAYHDEDNK